MTSAQVLISLGVAGAASLAIGGFALWSTDDDGHDEVSYRLGYGAAEDAHVLYTYAVADHLPMACEMMLDARHPDREYRGRRVAEHDFMAGCLHAFDR